MKRHNNILLIFLLLTITLPAQVVYDTIPEVVSEIGGHWWEELLIFRDFEDQALSYFDKVDFKNLDCYGEKVIVSMIFGKNGVLRDTKIVKSASPICDSIAFNFVNELKGWLPGLARGNFVNIPFVFPIILDSVKIKNWHSKFHVLFNATEKKYSKRKRYFDFFYSENYEEEIINDFEFFKNYIAETLRDSNYVYIISDYGLKRKESIVLKFNIKKNKSAHLLVRDHQKDWVLYEYNSLEEGKVRVPKDKNLLLIFYEEGTEPKLQTVIINSEKDMTIELELETYTKGRLLNEIKKYSP